MVIRHLLSLIIVATVSSGAQAVQVDLSTMSDPSGTYNVAFCGRASPGSSGLPGHAFVSYSHQLPGGDRDFLSIGLTVGPGVGAGSAGWSYFGNPVSGLLKQEQYTAISQNCLDVKVNKIDFDTARAYAQDPLAAMGLTPNPGTVFEAYKLGANDCMTFLILVAKSLQHLGLVVPDRGTGELPVPYVTRLISLNAQ